jgi:hypothetical protein
MLAYHILTSPTFMSAVYWQWFRWHTISNNNKKATDSSMGTEKQHVKQSR